MESKSRQDSGFFQKYSILSYENVKTEGFMKRFLSLLLLIGLSLFVSCQNKDLSSICKGADADSYDPNFKVWCPAQDDHYFVPVRFGCPPHGNGISPPIAWSGIPEGTTHLRVIVEDATCTYECDGCCKYHHWVLDFPLAAMSDSGPITESGIAEGAAADPALQQYVQPNSSDKKAYMPFCPPVAQTHAYIFKLITYKKNNGSATVTGRSQGMPLLFSLVQSR